MLVGGDHSAYQRCSESGLAGARAPCLWVMEMFGRCARSGRGVCEILCSCGKLSCRHSTLCPAVIINSATYKSNIERCDK